MRLRGSIEAKHFKKHPFQTGCYWHRLGWINQGMIEKERQDLETNIRS